MRHISWGYVICIPRAVREVLEGWLRPALNINITLVEVSRIENEELDQIYQLKKQGELDVLIAELLMC